MAKAAPRQLYEPCPHCGGLKITAESALPPAAGQRLGRELDRVLRAIFEGKGGVTDPAMLSIIGTVLEKQVFDGFGKDFVTADFTTTDDAMLTRLTQDVWHFSAAKNYQQLRDMTLALVGENGQARTFAQFEDACKAINVKYSRTWLLTEYNQAMGSATMAARWNEFEKNADIMPYLRYSTVGDRRVRDSHAALDGITRKIDDEFWATYYPPNGWNCRCSVDQLPGSKQKESKTVPQVPVPAMFQTNLAKSGLIYPKAHPYYLGVPQQVFVDMIEALPDKSAFIEHTTWDTGKKLRVHKFHGADEVSENIGIAQDVSKFLGYKHNIDLNPVIGGEAGLDQRRRIYGPDVFDKKCPDAKIGNELWEFTKYSNKYSDAKSAKSFEAYHAKKIRNALEAKGAQANNMVIVIPDNLDQSLVDNAVKGYLNVTTKKRKIIVFNSGSAKQYKN